MPHNKAGRGRRVKSQGTRAAASPMRAETGDQGLAEGGDRVQHRSSGRKYAKKQH